MWVSCLELSEQPTRCTQELQNRKSQIAAKETPKQVQIAPRLEMLRIRIKVLDACKVLNMNMCIEVLGRYEGFGTWCACSTSRC